MSSQAKTTELMNRAELINAACELLDHGIVTVPGLPSGKQTRFPWKAWQDAAPTPEMVENWITEWSDPNWPNGMHSTLVMIMASTVLADKTRLWVLDADNTAAIAFVKRQGLDSPFKVTTGRGCHFFFRCTGQYADNTAGLRTAFGVELDFKAFGVLGIAPYGGKVMEAWPGDWTDIPLIEPTEVPWLAAHVKRRNVIDLSGVKTKRIAVSLVEGQGRDSSLLSFIGTLVRAVTDIEEIYQAAMAVNNTYSPPLEERVVRSQVERIFNQHHGGDQSTPVAPPPPSSMRSDIPTLAELAQVGGILGELVEYQRSKAMYFHPEFALAAGLTVAGALLGRKVQGPTGLRTNLYTLAIAPSGSGKDSPRTAMMSLLQAAGLEKYIGPSQFQSKTGLRRALKEVGPMVAFLDEFGGHVASAKIKTSAAHGLISLLTEIFTSAGGKLQRSAYGDKERDDDSVVNPHLCLYATSSPAQIWEHITAQDFEDGFAARFLLVQVNKDRVRNPYFRPTEPVPDDLKRAMFALTGFGQEGGVVDGSNNIAAATKQEELVTIQYAPEAQAYLDAMIARLDEEYNRVRESDPVVAAILSRVGEYAGRLAVVRAVCDTLSRDPVSLDQMAWACAVAERIALDSIAASKTRIGRSDFDKLVKRAMGYIETGSEAGKSRTEIRRHAFGGHITPDELDQVLGALVDGGHVVTALRGEGTRKATVFRKV